MATGHAPHTGGSPSSTSEPVERCAVEPVVRDAAGDEVGESLAVVHQRRAPAGRPQLGRTRAVPTGSPKCGPADFGGHDVATVVAAGFSSAVTTIEGINRPDTDRFRLLRFNVHEDRFLAPTGLQSRALFFSSTSGLVWWLRSRGGGDGR